MRKVYIVANPAAGQDNLNIREVNALFHAAEIDWDLGFTKREGDGARLAQEAVARGVDVVAAYGGDGTVSEVASGLLGTNTPLAILPGGTANVMSVELGIPGDFLAACGLLTTEYLETRRIDVGQVDGRTFLLRLSIGVEAKMVEGADRDLKNRFGNLAYGFAVLSALRSPQVYRYEFQLDGKEIVNEGVACIIANSGNLGLPGLRLATTIEVDDGLLDVLVVRKTDVSSIIGLISSMMGQDAGAVEGSSEEDDGRSLRHYQARRIRVNATPTDVVQCDGELIGDTPKDISLLAGALRVIVPVVTREDLALAGV